MKSFEIDQERFKACADAGGVKRLPTGNVLVPKESPDALSIQDRFLASCPFGYLKKKENGELAWDMEHCNTCNFFWQSAAQFAGIMKVNPQLPSLWPRS